MRIRLRGTALSALTGVALAITVPGAAIAQDETTSRGAGGTVVEGADGLVRVRGADDDDRLALRRDGSRAVPFASSPFGAEGADGLVRVRSVHDGDGLALRRDGSRAVPFVADPSGAVDAPVERASGGVTWGDAGIGAAIALVTAATGAMLVVALRRLTLARRRSPTAVR